MLNGPRQHQSFQQYHKASWILWALVAYFTSLIIVGYELYTSRQSLQNNTKNEIGSLIQITDKRLDGMYTNTFLKLDKALLQIRNLELQKKDQIEEIHKVILKLNQENKYLITAITDESGRHITSSAHLHSNVDLSDRTYFQNLKNDDQIESIVSEPLISKTHKRWVIVFAKKIRTESGKFKGMLLVTFPIEGLTEILKSTLDRPGSNITLFTKELTFITRWPNIPELIGKKADIKKPQSFITYEFDDLISPIDNEHRFVGRQYVLNNEWILTVGFTVNELYSKWWFKFYTYIGLFLLFIVSIIVLYYRQFQLEKMMIIQEAKLINSAKLSSLGEIAGSIAHEINNPMSILQISFDLAKRELKTNELFLENKKLSNFFLKIERSISRINSILYKIRRISTDQGFEQFQDNDLKNLAHSVIDIYKSKIQEKRIQLIVKESISKVTVKCQELTIQQVLMNVIQNAIDAINDSYAQEMTDRWIKIEILTDNHHPEIKISNSGPRIPESVQDKMFDIFYTTKHERTGLGLPLSKKFMIENNGDIEYDSEALNTTFIIRFNKTN